MSRQADTLREIKRQMEVETKTDRLTNMKQGERVSHLNQSVFHGKIGAILLQPSRNTSGLSRKLH